MEDIWCPHGQHEEWEVRLHHVGHDEVIRSDKIKKNVKVRNSRPLEILL